MLKSCMSHLLFENVRDVPNNHMDKGENEMKKLQLLQKITENGVVAVLRGDSADQVIAMAEQAIAGGIKVIEITMTVPSALKAIEKLSRMYHWNTQIPKSLPSSGPGLSLKPRRRVQPSWLGPSLSLDRP